MLTERLEALLTDYFRPRPAHGPAGLARRVVRQARGRRDDIERLLSRLAIAATGSGITRIHRGTLRLPARGAARIRLRSPQSMMSSPTLSRIPASTAWGMWRAGPPMPSTTASSTSA